MSDPDPRYGSSEPTTSYEKSDEATTSLGRSRSVWALSIAAVFILAAVIAVFFWPASRTAPSSQGAADTGTTTTLRPAQQNP